MAQAKMKRHFGDGSMIREAWVKLWV